MSVEAKPFGKTGHQSTRVVFGAAFLGRVSQEEADRAFELLLEFGVNHLDVAASYGDGLAERRIGRWMPEHRTQFFLASKTEKRTCAEARDELRGSLERLGVDSLDLIQLHNLTDPEQWERALGPGGALEALVEAREQKLVRFIGVTGHGYTAPRMHLRSLEAFPFDSVLLPYNYLMMQDSAYARDFQELAERCTQEQVAVQTIKSLARRPWPAGRQGTTWYQPLEDEQAVNSAVAWVLGDPRVFLISPSDGGLLPRVLEAATRAAPRPGDAQMEELARSRGMQPIFRGREMIT
ncbi:MAG: aldo/keto reductase [Spirochaetales bacterium]|nr:aldo/keto reductase [Spirochaetales bacterium]